MVLQSRMNLFKFHAGRFGWADQVAYEIVRFSSHQTENGNFLLLLHFIGITIQLHSLYVRSQSSLALSNSSTFPTKAIFSLMFTVFKVAYVQFTVCYAWPTHTSFISLAIPLVVLLVFTLLPSGRLLIPCTLKFHLLGRLIDYSSPICHVYATTYQNNQAYSEFTRENITWFCTYMSGKGVGLGLGRRCRPRGVSKLFWRDNHKITKGGKENQQICIEPLQASLTKQSAKRLN